jgi:hypothetical protein
MMRIKRKIARLAIPLAVAALATLAVAAPAQAKLVKEFTKFENCPWKNPEVRKCIFSVTKSGEVVMGSKTVPIVNPVTLQGGFGKANAETKISAFFGATNGITLSKTGQPLPGGLAGLVKCNEISNFILRAACEWTFENGLTGVTTVLELAKPATAIQISEFNMSRKEGVALQLPVKAHLENPFLGSNCYVGSESNPIIWNLTSGATAPPPPNTSIEGNFGTGSFQEEGFILHIEENKLVDNAWAAPKATGCGGIFSFLIDPIVNATSGLPAAAGKNTTIMKSTVDLTTAAGLKIIDEENP